MKKLFLLLILSFFSAQSFAASCPDGSEPVKSISDDGTYFVYNCSGSADSSNETSSTKSNGLLPNTLKQIKVIKDWEPVSDFGALKEYAKQVPIDEFRVRKNKEWNCVDRITNVNPYPDEDTHRPWFHCQAYVHGLAASNPQILRDILLTWASATKDPMFVIPVTKSGGYNVAGYDIPSTIGTFAQSYAFWYDEIEYTPDERKRVDAYMTKKLIEQKFPVMNYGRRPCDINNINSVFHKDTGTNNCGNIRMKVAVGEIMLGFRLENQILLDKGHDDMYVVHAFINEDGININHASRGGNTVNYSWEYTYYASLLAEIYDSVGYDYLEHKLPRGAKVHEHLSFNYRLLKDFKLTAPWAKHNVGSLSNSYSKIKNLSQEDFEKSDDFGQNVYRWEDGDKEFVKAHTKFVKRYMPELYTFDVKNYMGSKFNESPNFGVHPYMLHLGNNFIEENNNVELIQKQVELEDEKDDVSCKVSSLRGGEYIARWYVAIPEENWEPKYKGMDILTLAKDNCKGKIHSNERFWPSSSDGDKLKNSSIRDKLKIRWKPNGHITISGDLVYWPLGRNLYTFLEGNLNNGKISGEHEEGDKITIEIISKKKFEEGKQVELEKSSSKLSIFEVDGQTFSLSIDKADLTIPRTIRLDRDERYLQPYQLHKAVISGRLKTKSNGSKRFKTLVYKYDTKHERKLVIHVDDPTIKPLKRHKDALEKKCGSKVMEWGWLSFISQTSEIKNARHQQCIYDYYKSSNDNEAFELFQAILGATDSILDYLETMVDEPELKTESPKVTTSDLDPTVSKVIEVIQGDKFIVDIAEPHELAGTNINLNLRNIDAPDAIRSCPKQLELGIKVKDIVAQKLSDASSIKLKNYRKTSKAVIAEVIVDGKDLGTELIGKGFASDEFGYWKAYFCSALTAMTSGNSHSRKGNFDKAIFWYERAIFLDPDYDKSTMTYRLSELYSAKGDNDKSIDYLKQSANLEFMQAEETLGAAYMNGSGVKKDTSEAKYWLKKAHEHGSKIAEDICGCEF